MVSRYVERICAHAHLLGSDDVVLLLFPAELDHDKITNFQYENVDDTQLGKCYMTTVLHAWYRHSLYYDVTTCGSTDNLIQT